MTEQTAEQVIKDITSAIQLITSKEFIRQLRNADGFKAIDDLAYQMYPSPEEDEEYA